MQFSLIKFTYLDFASLNVQRRSQMWHCLVYVIFDTYLNNTGLCQVVFTQWLNNSLKQNLTTTDNHSRKKNPVPDKFGFKTWTTWFFLLIYTLLKPSPYKNYFVLTIKKSITICRNELRLEKGLIYYYIITVYNTFISLCVKKPKSIYRHHLLFLIVIKVSIGITYYFS